MSSEAPSDPESRATLGYLDEPDPAGSPTVVDNGLLRCHGWVLFDGRIAGRADVFVNGCLVGAARLGLPRADLADKGPDGPMAGFELVTALDTDELGFGLKDVRVVARSLDGRDQQVLGPSSIHLAPGPGSGAPARQPRFPAAPQTDGMHVVAFTSQLGYGGAQLYLQDLVTGLQAGGEFRTTVVSTADGPLRADLERDGVAVHITAARPLTNPAMFAGRTDELAAWLRARNADVVLINGMDAFAGAVAAARAGVPYVWAIHESYPLPAYWYAAHGSGGVDPEVSDSAEQAMYGAAALVFEADATRALYARHARPGRAIVVPYGIDMDALDDVAGAWTRRSARAQLALPDDATILLCMGTFEARKSQALLIRALASFAGLHGDVSLVLVGDIGGEYATFVRSTAAASGLGNRVRIEPVRADAVTWYIAADALVSASDVESMPRSAIEAMAIGTPVLAAAAYGVPELIEDGVTGYLFEPRDAASMIEAISGFLARPEHERRAVAAAARAHVRAHHRSSGYVGEFGRMFRALHRDPAAMLAP